MNKFADFKSLKYQIFDLPGFGLGVALSGVDEYGTTIQVEALEAGPRWGYMDHLTILKPRDTITWELLVPKAQAHVSLRAAGFQEVTDLFSGYLPSDLEFGFSYDEDEEDEEGCTVDVFFASRKNLRNLACGKVGDDNIREGSFVEFPDNIVGDNSMENMFELKDGWNVEITKAALERLGYTYNPRLI